MVTIKNTLITFSFLVLCSCNLIDKDAPIITLLGDQEMHISFMRKFVDPGYKAEDKRDGDLTKKVQVNSNVNTAIIGEYLIEYSVQDKSDNMTKVERKVIVDAPMKDLEGVYNATETMQSADFYQGDYITSGPINTISYKFTLKLETPKDTNIIPVRLYNIHQLGDECYVTANYYRSTKTFMFGNFVFRNEATYIGSDGYKIQVDMLFENSKFDNLKYSIIGLRYTKQNAGASQSIHYKGDLIFKKE